MFSNSLRRISTSGSATSLLGRYAGAMTATKDRRDAGLSNQRGQRANRLDALMRRIVESNQDGILTLGQDNRVAMANQAALDMLGYPLSELQSLTPEEYLPGFRSFTESVSDDYSVGQGYRETMGVRRDGTGFAAEICVNDLVIRQEKLRVIILRDVTESKEQRRQLEHQALHDALTGLPNRVLLNDRLRHAIHTAQRAGESLALLLIDLDEFKEVNDTLGHHVGDLLLIEIGRRLKAPLRESDTVARLGGDEFAILLPAGTDLHRAQEVAMRLRRTILSPIKLQDDLSAHVGASIGIAMYPENSTDAIRLMQCADVAMYCAKDGPDKVVVYDVEKDGNNVRSLAISSALREAIEADLLELVYQPKLCLQTGEIKCAEALARWNHPELGVINPEEFISHAERTGQIRDLTNRLLKRAIRQLRDWRDAGLKVDIALNLSPRSLHDEHLPERLDAFLSEYGVAAQHLSMEITETAIVLDPTKARDILERLNAMGIKIAIDDFGTGYSSLSILQRLPIQELKIDRTFVIEMLEQKSDHVIVTSTINLAHNLGMQVVAEGVESDVHAQALSEMGCDFAQGYSISKALSGSDFANWIKTYIPPQLSGYRRYERRIPEELT